MGTVYIRRYSVFHEELESVFHHLEEISPVDLNTRMEREDIFTQRTENDSL
jgi:hypothetical protein